MAFLKNETKRPRATLLLAHGAGSAMDTPFMDAFSQGLGGQGLSVARFEFDYMAARRQGGPKRPPPRVERLQGEYRAAIERLAEQGPLFIGGKSLGGRVASMVAQELYDTGQVAGLVCLGYPFHPPGKLQKLRTDHLMTLSAPMLIVQGERDPFGTRQDVAGYNLPGNIRLHWATDGDHDLKPRKKSGMTAEQNWQEAIQAIGSWVGEICP